MNRMVRIAVAAVFFCGLVPAQAQAQSWPSRTIRIIVPFTPGGTNDLVARLLAERLPPILGQPFVVENRPGASGDVGSLYVAQQPPDGYTLLIHGSVAASGVFRSLPYDPYKDFAPISQLANVVLVLAVNPGIPSGTLGELIAYARANPGKLSFGSPGAATPQHFGGELLRMQGKFDAVHVPYKGGGPIVAALLSGEISFTINAANTVTPHVASGKVRLLAVPMPVRSTQLPNVPTIAETIPSYDLPTSWLGFYATGGTPAAIVERLNFEAIRIIRDPQVVKDRLTPIGLEPVGSTPEQVTAAMKSNFARYTAIAKEGKIKPE